MSISGEILKVRVAHHVKSGTLPACTFGSLIVRRASNNPNMPNGVDNEIFVDSAKACAQLIKAAKKLHRGLCTAEMARK